MEEKQNLKHFCEKLFVGWNICFHLTCQGLIWIFPVIFDKADGLCLSLSDTQSISALDFRNIGVQTSV